MTEINGKLISKVPQIIKDKGDAQFMADTKLSYGTMYSLKEGGIPHSRTVEKICRAYGLQPNDIIIFEA